MKPTMAESSEDEARLRERQQLLSEVLSAVKSVQVIQSDVFYVLLERDCKVNEP